MDEGFLYGSRRDTPLYWLPENEKLMFFYRDEAVWKRKGIVFDKEALLSPAKLRTYLCQSCGYGIFPFQNP